jgi:hypothetical protein
VSEETGQAYIAANFGASSGLHALDLEDGSLVWDAAYDDLSEPEILRITDETVYLSASTEEETFLIALETD